MRVATIDIGTVTCRLLIADVQGSEIVPVVRRAVITNIGEGTDATGLLKPEAIDRTVSQVAEYVDIIHSFQHTDNPVVHVTAMATSASRDARNADVFVGRLSELGVTLSVIPGTREAELSFLGAANDFRNEHILVADVGGGSTELVCGRACTVAGTSMPQVTLDKMVSCDIGCRRMTERFLMQDPPTPADYDAARAWAQSILSPQLSEISNIDRVVAVAGTATTAVSMKYEMHEYDPDKVHKQVITKTDLEQLFEKLSFMSLKQKQQIVGLQPERACVIVAGFLILDTVLSCAQVDAFSVSEHDILQGIALSVPSQGNEK